MTINTVRGLAYWAKLSKPVPGYNPEEKQWSLDVTLDSENASKLVSLGLTKGLKNKGDSRGAFYTFIRREIKKKSGKPNQPIAVTDSNGNPWPANKLIGNGSEVEVKFNVFEVPAFGKLPAHNKDAILEVSVVKHIEYVRPEEPPAGSNIGSPSGYKESWKGDVV
jgi:hypothetical protein